MTNKRLMYHTQEKRGTRLTAPEICTKNNAWLGNGYYFWDDLMDAFKWGNDSKKATGSYEVYKADIDCENVLDTVFDEDSYKFWVRQIEKFAKQFDGKFGKPTIKDFNSYCVSRQIWRDISGILFQDLPTKPEELIVEKLFHRKRIQAAVFDLVIINNFVFHSEDRCT